VVNGMAVIKNVGSRSKYLECALVTCCEDVISARLVNVSSIGEFIPCMVSYVLLSRIISISSTALERITRDLCAMAIVKTPNVNLPYFSLYQVLHGRS
jgi:hypothetical protein